MVATHVRGYNSNIESEFAVTSYKFPVSFENFKWKT